MNIIDACLHLHNFIVDWRLQSSPPSPESFERSVFDEDCGRFLAVHPECRFGGMFGGEDEERWDGNGNKLVGGRPANRELQSKAHGKQMRYLLRDEFSRLSLACPPTNWYKENNRVLNL